MSESRVLILQTCLPDYRMDFFDLLISGLPNCQLVCGKEYFTPNLKLCLETAESRQFIENRFYLRKSFLWQSGSLMPALEADVLIAEFNPRILSTWLILLRRRWQGKRTLLWGHLWGQHGPKWISRKIRLMMLGFADGAICYTPTQAVELNYARPGYPRWAANNSCVHREDCWATSGPRTAPCITYVGRLIPEKKPRVLLEAFARAIPRLPADAKLLLVGDGTERPALQTRITELGLDHRVELPGHVGEVSALRAIYDRSVVAVSPGYIGLSAIQSMAHGVPMLVSRDEPHSPEIEACIEGETCAFFATDDVSDLADKLVGFCAPSSVWPAKRPGIARFIAAKYSFEHMVEIFQRAVAFVGPAAEHLPPRVAVAWAQYGPYHFARFRHLGVALGRTRLVGLEFSNHTSTYAWARNSSVPEEITTLTRDIAAEKVSILTIYFAALRLFRSQRVSVVFVPSYWPASSLALILAARTAGCRVVMMNDSHALTAKAKGVLAWLKRSLVLQFDAALVAGTPQKEYFTGMGMDPNRIVLGYDAVDNDHFSHRAAAARTDVAATRARHGLPDRYFLNVGRMVRKKNLATLVSAYQQTKARLGADCPALVFVGSGVLEHSLRAHCLALGLSVYLASPGSAARPGNADVYFFGFRQVDDLPDFYALAECFVLPSHEEEWGLVVNEAMACGLPVIVSRVAGCARDLVREGENGFLFDPLNVTDLAGHLEAIAGDVDVKERLGLASQRLIADWGCERFAAAAREAVAIATR